MTQGSSGSPIFLQRIDANGTGGGVNVGMVDFGEEVATGWRGGEIGGED